MRPFALSAGEGKKYVYGVPHTIMAGEAALGRGAAFFEFIARNGEEPPLHTHTTEDEVFYVLDGSLSFHCDDQSFFLEKGGFIYLPCGLPHTYSVAPGIEARLLVSTFPVREPAGSWGGYAADVETMGEALT